MLNDFERANATKRKNTNIMLTDKEKIEAYENRMLTKAEVAEKFGMTVSWLNNSQNEIAIALRDIGIKLGRSPSSPVRYPLSEIAELMNTQLQG